MKIMKDKLRLQIWSLRRHFLQRHSGSDWTSLAADGKTLYKISFKDFVVGLKFACHFSLSIVTYFFTNNFLEAWNTYFSIASVYILIL